MHTRIHAFAHTFKSIGPAILVQKHTFYYLFRKVVLFILLVLFFCSWFQIMCDFDKKSKLFCYSFFSTARTKFDFPFIFHCRWVYVMYTIQCTEGVYVWLVPYKQNCCPCHSIHFFFFCTLKYAVPFTTAFNFYRVRIQLYCLFNIHFWLFLSLPVFLNTLKKKIKIIETSMSFQTKPNLICDIKYHSFVITNSGMYISLQECSLHFFFILHHNRNKELLNI